MTDAEYAKVYAHVTADIAAWRRMEEATGTPIDTLLLSRIAAMTEWTANYLLQLRDSMASPDAAEIRRLSIKMLKDQVDEKKPWEDGETP